MDGLDISTEFLAVIVAVIIVLSTLAIFLLVKRRKRGNVITLVGLCDAGKTLLFTRLVNGKYTRTFTSMTETKFTYQINKSTSVEVVDIPGHERLRERMFNKYLDNLRGVVLVIDSVNFIQDFRDVASMLYDILANWRHKHVPLLIACNKQDLSLAKDCDYIKSELEKEITLVRKSRLAGLQGMEGGGTNKRVHLGKEGKDFEFSDLYPIKVEFMECSGLGKSEDSAGDIDNIKEWICTLN
ncbi:signal recognition particle receptor subunit beta-like isoform X2 [Dysidea avara]|uniref:signal recognition particle receptor subunit beta-like isoform X2 n=1 Tax=Dysidea avara TaxID=196820 RepID=UPI003325343A